MKNYKHLGLLICGLLLSAAAWAQEGVIVAHADQTSAAEITPSNQTEAQPMHILTNYVEVGGSYLPMSDKFGHVSGGYARASVTRGKNVWFGEINGQHEFADAGTYIAAGDTYTINHDWYGSLTVGSSIGGFFWPRFRADGFINKKWFERGQFITTAGFGYYASKDVHRDHSFYAGSTYYFSKPWIIEEGVHFNLSNPGTVYSPSGFVAVTHGRDKHYFLTVRTGLGEEAYQLVGPTASLNDFTSQTFTVTWRKWVHKSWGVNIIGDFYHSPFYSKGGSLIGVFKDF
jgi:YaiO family outer membrane protein